MVTDGQQTDILTLPEIARYLKVSEKTILRMLQAGDLPGAKVSNQWRFVRSLIDDWLTARTYATPRKQLVRVIGTTPDLVPLARLVSPRRVIVSMKPGAKGDLLSQLVKPLVSTGMVEDGAAYRDELLAREEVVSTAIGHGVACPHVRDPEDMQTAQPCAVLGICKAGADFDSLDGRKTFVFVLPCANSETAHLRLMARMSFILRRPGVVKALREAGSKRDVMKLLSLADAEIARDLLSSTAHPRPDRGAAPLPAPA